MIDGPFIYNHPTEAFGRCCAILMTRQPMLSHYAHGWTVQNFGTRYRLRNWQCITHLCRYYPFMNYPSWLRVVILMCKTICAYQHHMDATTCMVKSFMFSGMCVSSRTIFSHQVSKIHQSNTYLLPIGVVSYRYEYFKGLVTIYALDLIPPKLHLGCLS